MRFKSIDFTSQNIIWRACCSSLLLIYLCQSLLIALGHYLVWVKFLNPQATFQMGLCDAAVCYDSWSDLIYPSPDANPDLAIGKSHPQHNRAYSKLYSWCDTGGCSAFTNSSLHIDSPIWPKDFELWFISPKDFVPLLYCPVFVRLNSVFLTAILPYRPVSQNFLFIVDTFFDDICAVVFGAVSLHTSWWLKWNCPLFFQLLVFFCLIFLCLLTV